MQNLGTSQQLHLQTKLENINYKVYFTNAKYEYNGEKYTVKENELMIAIK